MHEYFKLHLTNSIAFKVSILSEAFFGIHMSLTFEKTLSAEVEVPGKHKMFVIIDWHFDLAHENFLIWKQDVNICAAQSDDRELWFEWTTWKAHTPSIAAKYLSKSDVK